MATKWKKFTRNSWVKAVAWLLILVLSALAAWQSTAFVRYLGDREARGMVFNEEVLLKGDISEEYLADELANAAQNLAHYANLGDGTNVDQYDLINEIYHKYVNNSENYAEDTTEASDSMTDAVSSVYPASTEEGTEALADVLTDDNIDTIISVALQQELIFGGTDAKNFRTWLQSNRGVSIFCREQIIKSQQETVASWKAKSDDFGTRYQYYASATNANNEVFVLSNMQSDDPKVELTDPTTFTTSSGRMVCLLEENGSLYCENNTTSYKNSTGYDAECSNIDTTTFVVAFQDSYLKTLSSQYPEVHQAFCQTVAIVGCCALLILLCVIILFCGAGRSDKDDEVHLIWFDRIWTEIQITLWALVLTAFSLSVSFCGEMYYSVSADVFYALLIGTFTAFVGATGLLLLSAARRIKAKQWLNGWILWRVFHASIIRGINWIGLQFHKSPLHVRVILVCVLTPLACIFWFTIPFIIAGLLFFGMRATDNFKAVTEGAHAIRLGNTDTKIVLNHAGKELTGLADDLNSISEGLSNAVDTAVKSERLKSELISNVSHDIKTPLTSIITYVDLLKKCDIQDATAQEYIGVLDQKAQRLRILTSDLFEASKASSGAIQTEMVKTDMEALLRQAIGERSEHLEKAGLELRVKSPAPVYVRADGRLLWRILDNLLSNCSRYAQHGSRVYIDIMSGSAFVTLTMKNISAHELNISADELMERFTRGDRSRHTEGSGLGLSIAKSLAELMGGSCRVEIDGDLFKAIVTIPTWSEPEIIEAPEAIETAE